MSNAGQGKSRPDFRARVTIEAAISPSEDPAKVVVALRNVVKGAGEDASVGPRSVALVTDDVRTLSYLRDQLRDRHVRSAARRQLLLNSEGRRTSLMLNRQAAAAGVVSVCGSPDESPLGPIYAVIESDRLDVVIDWLTAYEG